MPTCDVCGRWESVGIACSVLGPFSLAYCQECLDHYAEPLKYIHATVDIVGGLEHINKTLIEDMTSWKDGRYITWNEIAALYKPQPD